MKTTERRLDWLTFRSGPLTHHQGPLGLANGIAKCSQTWPFDSGQAPKKEKEGDPEHGLA